MEPENKDRQIAFEIARRVAEKNGRVYFVGGYVRDRLMGRENKDIDIEVHGISPEELRTLLRDTGRLIEMGASFGVFGLKGSTLDIAMPRKEKATGRGHRDFDVSVDPYLGTEKAAMRRDFTVNALMEDVLTGEILDPFGGLDDIKKKVLRHVNRETFAEDPLRVLRAAQFAARFGFTVAPETVSLCRQLDLSPLSRERIEDEFRKALLKADAPGVFFEVLNRMDQLGVWFPEFADLLACPISSENSFSPWDRTLAFMNKAAENRDRTSNPLGFILSAAVYGISKLGPDGPASVDRFLNRVFGEKHLKALVRNTVSLLDDVFPLAVKNRPVYRTNDLFDRAFEPEDLITLAAVKESLFAPDTDFREKESFLRKRLARYRSMMEKPFVGGDDLIAAGLTPGKDFSELLALAHRLRLQGVPKEESMKLVLGRTGNIKEET